MIRKNPYQTLEKKLGYRFKKKTRLLLALTHPSFRHERKETEDNQRLEFLGDAALGLVCANYLFQRFPNIREGRLTNIRSRLTNTKTLSKIGGELELEKYILLGKGEEKTGGRNRTSNLADAVESILGAAYLEGGIKAVDRIFRIAFKRHLEEIHEDSQDNPKGVLQEMAQKKWKISPQYRIVGTEGPPHAPQFIVEVTIGNDIAISGKATNKRQAEKNAARAAIEKLNIE